MATSASYIPPELNSLMGVIDTYIRWDVARKRGDRKYEKYHPSEWGKAQPLSAIVQTPTGPVRMGDLTVGDEVCDPHGGITKVVKIHPQGKKPIYRVKFADGDYTSCCEDHLWEVNSSYLGFVKPKLMTTKQIMEKYIAPNGSRCLTISLPQPLKLESDASYVISPYMMGAILGDGCLRCNSLDFTNIDEEIVNRIKEDIDEEHEVLSRSDVQHRIAVKKPIGKIGTGSKVNVYKQELRRLGLFGLKTQERYIPDEYMYTTEENRFELIRGLMDTDGTIDVRGYPRFSTSSEKMANQFKWLVESVGGVCCIRHRKTTNLLSYRCDIRHNDVSKFFFLSRKKKRAKLRKNSVKRIFADISYIGEEEAQCITVANDDGLYLTDHCIVTHNCLRKQQYKHYAHLGKITYEAKDHGSQKQRLFDTGHSMHERWAEWYFANAGCLRGYWKCTNPYCHAWDDNGNFSNESLLVADLSRSRVHGKNETLGCFCPEKCICGNDNFHYQEVDVVSEEMNILGHADMVLDFSRMTANQFEGVRSSFNIDVLPKKPIVVDMKTCSSWAWKKQIIKSGPYLEHIVQVTLYAHILDCDYGVLIYECKDNSEALPFKVDRNDEIFDTAVWQAQMMQKMVSQGLLPPPRPKDKANMECKSCEFSVHCHGSAVWDDPEFDTKRRKFYKNLLFD